MNDYLVVYIKKDVVCSIDNKTIMQRFQNMKTRRRQLWILCICVFFYCCCCFQYIIFFLLLDCVIYACWGTPWKNFLESPLNPLPLGVTNEASTANFVISNRCIGVKFEPAWRGFAPNTSDPSSRHMRRWIEIWK